MKLFGRKKEEQADAAASGNWKKHRGRTIALTVVCILLSLVLLGMIAWKMFAQAPTQNESGLNWANSTPQITFSVEAPKADAKKREDVYTFLAIGRDQENVNTDTMMVGMMDIKRKEVNVISIPRDLLVNVPGNSKKVNGIYNYHYKEALAEGLSEEKAEERALEGLVSGIQDLIGYKVDFYAFVDMDGFIDIIDAIDGVDFDVPKPMVYYDPGQELEIFIAEGMQHLDGQAAYKVVRYRMGDPGYEGYEDGDIGRIRTQQAFLKAVAKKMLSIGTIPKINELSKIVSSHLDTDLNASNIAYLGQKLLSIGTENIHFYRVPGDDTVVINQGSFVSVYLDEWLEMINTHLNPYDQEITEDNLNVVTFNNGKFYSTTGEFAGDTFYRDRW